MIQIDALKVHDNNTVVCNLYTDNRCVKILMTAQDYESLMRDVFFIRNGQTKILPTLLIQQQCMN